MDRHVIANMGAELGATTTVFPSDDAVRALPAREGREDDWWSCGADARRGYDVARRDRPLHARAADRHAVQSRATSCRCARSPGEQIYQAYIGSSANPGCRDFAIAAAMVARPAGPRPRFASTSTPPRARCSRTSSREGLFSDPDPAGARIHQAGCNGCIGMGQAPATGRNQPAHGARATSPAAPARARTACVCAARRPRPPRRSPASSPTRATLGMAYPRWRARAPDCQHRDAGAAAAAAEARGASSSKGRNRLAAGP